MYFLIVCLCHFNDLDGYSDVSLNRPNLINPIIYSAETVKFILIITIGGLMIVFPKLACRATGLVSSITFSCLVCLLLSFMHQ